jgi:hypothetical protein
MNTECLNCELNILLNWNLFYPFLSKTPIGVSGMESEAMTCFMSPAVPAASSSLSFS